MAKRQGKSGTIDIKAVLAEDEEFVRALVAAPAEMYVQGVSTRKSLPLRKQG
jgi:hypothetical protein